MSSNVRISEELLPLIDRAVEQAKDAFGVKRYLSRREVVDEAVKRLLKELGIMPERDAPVVGAEGEVEKAEEVPVG